MTKVSRIKVSSHYKKFFDLQDMGLAENDHLMIDWGVALCENQTTEKDKRIKELEEALSELVHLHNCEQEGLLSGQPTPEMWFEAVEKASEVLTKNNE
jgi:hypothetical protein